MYSTPSSTALVKVLISILYPVKETAKRALIPLLPIANEKLSSLTTATTLLFSSLTATPITSAGFKASAI